MIIEYLKNRIQTLFIDKTPYPVETETEIDLFWNKPIFKDYKVKALYEDFLLHAGRCPECEDLLFIDISFEDKQYKVIKRCLNRNCNYTEDISIKFNESLGLTITPNKESSSINEGDGYSTGYLKKSVPSKSENMFFYGRHQLDGNGRYNYSRNLVKIKIVDKLPHPSKDNSNSVFVIKSNGYSDVFDLYMSVYNVFVDGYEWVKVNSWDDGYEEVCRCDGSVEYLRSKDYLFRDAFGRR